MLAYFGAKCFVADGEEKESEREIVKVWKLLFKYKLLTAVAVS
jgi:hypothetical protein